MCRGGGCGRGGGGAVVAVLVAEEVLAVVVGLAAVTTLVLGVSLVAVGKLCRHLAPLGTINAYCHPILPRLRRGWHVFQGSGNLDSSGRGPGPGRPKWQPTKTRERSLRPLQVEPSKLPGFFFRSGSPPASGRGSSSLHTLAPSTAKRATPAHTYHPN